MKLDKKKRLLVVLAAMLLTIATIVFLVVLPMVLVCLNTFPKRSWLDAIVVIAMYITIVVAFAVVWWANRRHRVKHAFSIEVLDGCRDVELDTDDIKTYLYGTDS